MLFVRDFLKTFTNVKYAAIFGSYLRGSSDPFSDIDILVVCDRNQDGEFSRENLQRLSCRIGRTIHLTAYNIDEFEKCLKYRDYKLLSILEGATFLIDDKDFTPQLKRFKKGITEESVQFNEAMGIMTMNSALQNLKNLQDLYSYPPLSKTSPLHSLCLRNSHLAYGYLLAIQRMRRTNNTTTLRELRSEAPVLGTLISAEKRNKRKNDLKLADVLHYTLMVRSEYVKNGLLPTI